MRLEGKTAIITGAGGGIGRAVAQCFAEEGATIVLNGRRVAPLFETRDLLTGTGAEVIVQPGDVSVRSDCQSVVEAARLASGRVDILVNNAAVDQEVAFIEMTEEGWDEVIDINLKGPFLMSSYNVSKNGLMGLSRCIAVEMASRHIRSNVVSPGATDTEMIARAAGPELMDYMRDRFDRVPMRRLIATREIAQACLFLASDESSGMTGAELVVDGGAVANMYMFETIPEFPAGRAAAPSY
jgi:NAD(P)-dependent dehydrogenase (short-subunit alcohol dehydrogenase family)